MFKRKTSDFLWFFIPSALGILLFLTPIFHNKKWLVLISIITSSIKSSTKSFQVGAILGVLGLGVLISFIKKSGLKMLFLRLAAFILSILIYYRIGPEVLYLEDTGLFILYGLLPTLFIVISVATIFLPLLTDFGLVELIGGVASRVMRPLFKLPGNAAIDCLTSWLGDEAVGIMLTNKQYGRGVYTAREAAIIATTFSFVSLSFSLIVIYEVGLPHMIPHYFLSIFIVGIALAFIMPRIPPLSSKKDLYLNDEKRNAANEQKSFRASFDDALEKSRKSRDLNLLVKLIGKNVFEVWFNILPMIMVIGTTALILGYVTPIFSWLGAPFIPLLELFRIPEAELVSKSIVVGFADMFLPALMAREITPEMPRFFIAVLSVSQLIFMSEVGGILISSKIPINLKDLVLIFLLRTVISIPIIALICHLIF